MEQYRDLVTNVLQQGTITDNRTDVYTLSSVGHHYSLSLDGGFPLMTTKHLGGSRWQSLKAEFLWYLSGQTHIRDLTDYTSIWDPWADDDGTLDTAYGRFWRRYPLPQESHQQAGESWADATTPHEWLTTAETTPNTPFGSDADEPPPGETPTTDDRDQLSQSDPDPDSDSNTHTIPVNPSRPAKQDGSTQQHAIDQLRYVIETLRESPTSRRAVMTAWHPGNATVSTLPPCHLMAVFNITNGQLHCHLTQRSGDIAVGIPFNIAAYALLTRLVRNELNRTRPPESQLAPGTFSHSIVDAHIYCGDRARASWYRENRSLIQSSLDQPRPTRETYAAVHDHVADELPTQSDRQTDHIPGLLTQLSREPFSRPQLTVHSNHIDEVGFDDITLSAYDSHAAIAFATVE